MPVSLDNKQAKHLALLLIDRAILVIRSIRIMCTGIWSCHVFVARVLVYSGVAVLESGHLGYQVVLVCSIYSR